MHIKNSKDFYAGLLFIFFGVAAMVLSLGYTIGTAARMGPGYFPFVLGGLLTALGLLIAGKGLSKGKGTRDAQPFRPKPVVLVLASVVLFGLLLRPLGLVLSTIILVFVASMASDEFRKTEAMISSLVLLSIVLISFVYFLNFQIPVWPSFLS